VVGLALEIIDDVGSEGEGDHVEENESPATRIIQNHGRENHNPDM